MTTGWKALETRLRRRRDDAHLRRLVTRLRREYGPPLVVIGMHRSGTSMVTRLLRQCGGYFGYLLDRNSEAVAFYRLNHEILSRNDSAWNVLAPDLNLYDDPARTDALHHVVRSRHGLWTDFFEAFGMFGEERRTGFPARPEKPRRNHLLLNWPRKRGRAAFWGWKGPHTTLTLPVWLGLFPEAKVLHVIRSGMECALSLWTRCQERGIGAPECLDLSYCFGLWEAYVAEGLRSRSLPERRYLEVRYEDLLEDPVDELQRIMGFVGAGVTIADRMADQVVAPRDRKDPWTEHPELLESARKSELFAKLYPEVALSLRDLPDPSTPARDEQAR